MKARLWAFMVILMLAGGRLAAQDATPEVEYRLRAPTVEEYLRAIPEIAHTWREEIPSAYAKITSNPIVEIMLLELQQTYTEPEIFAQTFDVLSPVYTAVAYSRRDSNPINNPPDWGVAMLRAWLRDNPTDLSQVETRDIPGYGWITATPIDLNNDGIDEFGLQVRFDSYQGYIVLQRDPSQPEGYRFVETPLYWLDLSAPYPTGIPTDFEVVHFGDLTGDDMPEWLVFAYRNRGCGTLYVLTWQDDRLVILLPEDAGFCSPGDFSIENVDDDPEPEIVYHQQEGDNWRCKWTITYRADWDGTRFVRLTEPTRLPDTLGCGLREAEPLMWENRVFEAIPLYEAGLAAGWDTPTDDNPAYFAELERYARTRLALAYALAAQMTQSREILAELGSETSTSEAIDSMITAMLGADSALDMCVAAYNVWVEYALSTFSYRALPITIEVGRQDYISGMMEDFPPEAKKAGCNAPQLIDARLENHIFTTNETPSTQLMALGIGVLDTFVGDFNMDGADEWLIWLDARVNPILFVPENEQYVLSRPEVRRPNIYTHFGVQQIPDQEELLFVDYAVLDFEATNVEYYSYDIGTVDCEEIVIRDDGANQGSLRLWRLQNDQLVQILEAPVCRPRPFAELFSADGRQLFAAAVTIQVDPAWNSQYDDVIYTWNSADQIYEPPAPEPATPTLAPFGTTVPALTDAYILEKLGVALSSLRTGDPDAVLTLVDETLDNYDPSVAQIVIDGLHYYRALTLEALNRPDDALAEYVAIYEAAPESAWGLLAALHLERVE